MKFSFLKGKNIFISGGTGSFGKKMISFLLKNAELNKIVIYSRDEQKQYKLKKEYKSKNIRFFIGDVRDKDRLTFAMQGIDIVIHAAALKHVDMAEYNPFEYIKTNVMGAQNIISSSLHNKVQKVIALSTDKASSPANLYGASKLLSDKLFVSANNYKGSQNIKFSVVRYGNVMGSRGSVIPLFLQQKKEKYFTVTDPEMTRFNITLQDGVRFVILALNQMLGGEISVNDSFNTAEFKKYYVILPNSEHYSLNLKEFLKKKKNSKKVVNNFSYNSKTNKDFLKPNEIKKLISENILDFES